MHNRQFTLYHTDGCHLCELAKVLVDQLNINYQYIDICEDSQLAELYGTTIPVFSDGKQALCWPFELDQLQAFIGV
ncbi:glutaredoxin family protein [Shewanella maritima]|uniref:glutaredoxin family protein n=1 Tax=Shewanella maritima TaxID=2520507 RepID=UPI0037351C5B